MNKTHKTKNNNYLIPHSSGYARFVTAIGTHLRWVHDDEINHLINVLECVDETIDAEHRNPPSCRTIWEHVTPPEDLDRSSNGGSYASLTRVELWEGWDLDNYNGYYLVTNHLYGSDYSGQGWNYEKFNSELDAHKFIEQFKTVKPSV
jgi:hypothetical protein